MTLISFIVLLVVLGIIFYLVENFVPMSPPFKTVLRIVAVTILAFMVLALFHVISFPFTVPIK